MADEFLDEMFDEQNIKDIGRWATFIPDSTDPNTVRKDLWVIFNRLPRNSSFAGVTVQNSGPNALAKKEDIQGIGKNSRIIIHQGTIIDEDAVPLYDDEGNEIVAEGDYLYNVVDFHLYADNIYELTLSED